MSDDIRDLKGYERRALLWLLGKTLSDTARNQVLAWAAADLLRSGISPLRWNALQCWVAGEVTPGRYHSWTVHEIGEAVEGNSFQSSETRLVTLWCTRVADGEIEEEVVREKEREAWLAFLAGTNPGAHIIQKETDR